MIGELSNTVELQLLLLGYTLPNQTIIRKNDNGQNKKKKRTSHVCCKREIVEESSAARMERDVAKLCNTMQRYIIQCQPQTLDADSRNLHQLA